MSYRLTFVAITSPSPVRGEAAAIRRLFDCGLDRLHLRRPPSAQVSEGEARDDCRRLLDSLPDDIVRHTVVHDYFDLARDYPLGGIHLNGRHPEPPVWMAGIDRPLTVSASCHSLAEVSARQAELDYVFLSPVFNSISKQGYASAFTAAELARAAAAGIINGQVIALGGCCADTIPLLRQWHFGGAALLGDVWRDTSADHYLSLRRLLG